MFETQEVDKVNQKLSKVIEEELKNIENGISKIIRNDNLLKEKYQLQSTLKGIGLMTLQL